MLDNLEDEESREGSILFCYWVEDTTLSDNDDTIKMFWENETMQGTVLKNE